jgi:hypothetical protein
MNVLGIEHILPLEIRILVKGQHFSVKIGICACCPDKRPCSLGYFIISSKHDIEQGVKVLLMVCNLEPGHVLFALPDLEIVLLYSISGVSSQIKSVTIGR